MRSLIQLFRTFAALFFTVLAARGSILMNSTVGVGGFDASIRIGRGTGAIFGESFDGNLETLCIVTAAHVLNATAPTTIGIRGSMNGGFNVSSVSSSEELGGPTGKEDLAFVSFTIDLSALGDLDQIDTLALLTPESIAAAPTTTPFTIQAYGYGATARPTTRLEKIDYMGALFVQPLGDPAYGYGVERTYTATINQFGNYDKDGYQYADMSYNFTNNGNNSGLGLGGDSGEGLIANGSVVGVYTRAQTKFFDAAAMPCNPRTETCSEEAIYQGARGTGLAFNAEDVDWLDNNCCSSSTPEPATWRLITPAMLFGGIVFTGKRRRSAPPGPTPMRQTTQPLPPNLMLPSA